MCHQNHMLKMDLSRRRGPLLLLPSFHLRRVVAELNLLRNVEANNQESGAVAKSSSLLSSFRSSSTYNHETETIFALPRMQLDFKSIHVQDPDEPLLTGGRRSHRRHSRLLLFLGSLLFT